MVHRTGRFETRGNGRTRKCCFDRLRWSRSSFLRLSRVIASADCAAESCDRGVRLQVSEGGVAISCWLPQDLSTSGDTEPRGSGLVLKDKVYRLQVQVCQLGFLWLALRGECKLGLGRSSCFSSAMVAGKGQFGHSG